MINPVKLAGKNKHHQVTTIALCPQCICILCMILTVKDFFSVQNSPICLWNGHTVCTCEVWSESL